MPEVEGSGGNVVFLSNHVYGSPRRAGFHWLADSFHKGGWSTTFVTTGLSEISRFLGDRRLDAVDAASVGKIVTQGGGVRSLVELTLFHPVDLKRKWLNQAAQPIMSAYGRRLSAALREVIISADIVIFESSAALLYLDSVSKLNPGARLVYRVSDDVRVIRFHPLIPKVEDEVVSRFHCVSLPSRILHRRFSHLENAVVHPHGLNKNAMDAAALENPFSGQAGPHAVSIGSTLFDPDFLNIAADLRPDVTFHVIGDVKVNYSKANIRQYGELPFAKAASFTMHADVGLALYKERAGAEYLAETSNKIGQYTYARLPVVAPRFASTVPRPHVFAYDEDRASIARALNAALSYDRSSIVESVPTWDEIRDAIISKASEGG